MIACQPLIKMITNVKYSIAKNLEIVSGTCF